MAEQFSFDVVSEVDMQEMKNVVDQATKEVKQRFDFKLSITLRNSTKNIPTIAFSLSSMTISIPFWTRSMKRSDGREPDPKKPFPSGGYGTISTAFSRLRQRISLMTF